MAALAALVGCSTGERIDPNGGGRDASTTLDGTTPRPDSSLPPNFDPFDPANACGAATIPTERVPGSLLFVLDRSGSMDSTPGGSGGGRTRWQLSVDAINSALRTMSDEMGAGLLLFPSGSSSCDVSSAPQVSIAPLAETRARIATALSSTGPGGGTPLYEATRRGYRVLDGAPSRGQRGLVVVTDGGETCDRNSAAFLDQVREERERNGYLTYAVGLVISNNDLSTMAFNGGTPRSPTCQPQCQAASCFANSDCPSGTRCRTFEEMFPGFPSLPVPEPGECTCNTAADCPSPMMCESFMPTCAVEVPPGFPCLFPGDPPPPYSACRGGSNCCHYDATASDFQRQFEEALSEIGRRFLSSCVFELPRGADPTTFDPALVNVGVTFEGEDRTVLRRSSDDSTESWNYTTADNDAIVIQGPICERLLRSSATVEIVLGCPTLLI